MPSKTFARLVEPFAGSAAVTLAAASVKRFETYLIADRLEPLIDLWNQIIAEPEQLASAYEALWLRERSKPIDGYYDIRSEFNQDKLAEKLLYLLARCVKNAVRFNPAGEFNQSPDKRRQGTRPDLMHAEILGAHRLLTGCCMTASADFMQLFEQAQQGDLFYLDPPYQGTSEGRDSRYFQNVERHRLLEGLRLLKRKGIPFILSYDGALGSRTYGEKLPDEIGTRLLVDVGRSSQATLNGDLDSTVESIYLSHELGGLVGEDSVVPLSAFEAQRHISFA
jgi:DNA adenine methylase